MTTKSHSKFRCGIPKIIHQTYHSKNLPPEIERSVQNIKALNPGWEHRLYDDADIVEFIRAHYSADVLNLYHRISHAYGAARADLFRYLLIYKIGGVYFDIKSSPNTALDEVIKPDDCYLLSNWKNAEGEPYQGWGLHVELRDIPGGEFQQWHIVAAPGHPFLEAVIAKVLANIRRYHPGLHGVGKAGVVRLTGPIAYTQAIAPIVNSCPHRWVDSLLELGFEYSVYGKDNKSHNAIFVSHYTELKSPVVTVGFLKTVTAPLISFSTRAFRKLNKTLQRNS